MFPCVRIQVFDPAVSIARSALGEYFFFIPRHAWTPNAPQSLAPWRILAPLSSLPGNTECLAVPPGRHLFEEPQAAQRAARCVLAFVVETLVRPWLGETTTPVCFESGDDARAVYSLSKRDYAPKPILK